VSRIGKQPIPVPAGVEVTIEGTDVTVKGPKGTLSQSFDPDMQITLEDGAVFVRRPTDGRRHRSLHGLTRTLIFNMVVGVSEGFRKDMEIVGVGYRAVLKGTDLDLSLGLSHPMVVRRRRASRSRCRHDEDLGHRHRQAAGRPGGGRDPLDPPAGAVQGQGYPLCGRVRPSQGRQGRQVVTGRVCRRARREGVKTGHG